MIKSMTGYSSLGEEDAVAQVSVTVKGVNHRFLDAQLRLPPALGAMEGRLRRLVQDRVARGRVEVTVALQRREAPRPVIEVNEPFVEALREALDHARARGLVAGTLTPGDLIRWPQAMTVREADEDGAGAAVEAIVERAVIRALDDFDGMRVREGELLARDLETRLGALAATVERLAAAADEGREATVARLQQRIADLGLDAQADPAAVAQEVVRVAGRSDITEEVTRFRAHVTHWQGLAAADEPCGRKLDFLVQEMNREINTIGSKADGPAVPDLVISAKAELERIREQVQNVE